MKKQIKHVKNEDVVLTIDGMNHEGMGVARLDGMAVFVQGALKGERVKAKLIKVAATYAIARVVELEETSPERKEPFCPVYRRCGGCSLQHMTYAESLRFKHQVVVDSMERLGGFKGIEVKPVFGMDHPYQYRNKAQYPIGMDGKRTVAGFYSRRTHDIVDASECGIQHASSELVRAAVLSWVTEYKVPVFNEETGEGLVRHIVTRVGIRTGEVLAMVVATKNRIPVPEKLINKLKKMVPGITGIVLNVNAEPGNIILGEENYILFGTPTLEDKLCGMTFEISPMSFYQVNPEQTEVLYRKAIDAADLKGTETVFDLYCGIGTISLVAAKKAGKVIGVEVVEEAVETARENATKNKITNAEFHVGTAEEVVPKLYADGVRADVVIVDPPRKGCDRKLLETIREMKPERIVYVSCNPSTLARDLKFLCASFDPAPMAVALESMITSESAESESFKEFPESGGAAEPFEDTITQEDTEANADGVSHEDAGITESAASMKTGGMPAYQVMSVQPVDMFPWTEHVESIILMTKCGFEGK